MFQPPTNTVHTVHTNIQAYRHRMESKLRRRVYLSPMSHGTMGGRTAVERISNTITLLVRAHTHTHARTHARTHRQLDSRRGSHTRRADSRPTIVQTICRQSGRESLCRGVTRSLAIVSPYNSLWSITLLPNTGMVGGLFSIL